MPGESSPKGPHKTPIFKKTSDGTADFGTRYNPLSGGVHDVQAPPFSTYGLYDSSAVPFSVSQAVTTTTHLGTTSLPNSTRTNSYREWCTERTKHTRTAAGVTDKYKAPATEAQSVGWGTERLVAQGGVRLPQHGMAMSKEARIAEDQLLGPRNIEPVAQVSKMYF